MTTDAEYNDGKNICNEIGGAVLTVLGNHHPLTVQALIDCLRQAQGDSHDYDESREKGMAYAIAILSKFTEAD
ncbi:hypothetical protein [Tatumella ptyseos]|uniref:hypothetical protein n=1 Tax=Tatumella ptyseos TaxID=82987 RepID=UPI0026EF72EE|nr:hypothetical protein [Tatumella ptyseos]WKX27563.1 hypothetical protein QJR74_05395 [Tatumella ptyseos]